MSRQYQHTALIRPSRTTPAPWEEVSVGSLQPEHPAPLLLLEMHAAPSHHGLCPITVTLREEN